VLNSKEASERMTILFLVVVLAGAQHPTPTAMRDVAREAEDPHHANRENTEESTSHRREED
jgi:hypothetical protein